MNRAARFYDKGIKANFHEKQGFRFTRMLGMDKTVLTISLHNVLTKKAVTVVLCIIENF